MCIRWPGGGGVRWPVDYDMKLALAFARAAFGQQVSAPHRREQYQSLPLDFMSIKPKRSLRFFFWTTIALP
jgi:hypothetical protein